MVLATRLTCLSFTGANRVITAVNFGSLLRVIMGSSFVRARALQSLHILLLQLEHGRWQRWIQLVLAQHAYNYTSSIQDARVDNEQLNCLVMWVVRVSLKRGP